MAGKVSQECVGMFHGVGGGEDSETLCSVYDPDVCFCRQGWKRFGGLLSLGIRARARDAGVESSRKRVSHRFFLGGDVFRGSRC